MSLSISEVDTDDNDHPLKGQGGFKQWSFLVEVSSTSCCIQIEKRNALITI